MSQPVMKISPQQVAQRIVEMVTAMPEAAEGLELPESHRQPEYWLELLSATPQARRLMELMREMPLFTNLAPADSSPEAWRAVMRKNFTGPDAYLPRQATRIIKRILRSAQPLPAQRPMIRWRDGYQAGEVIQRVRPTETDAYLHNPHRGTTTFQRFQGDQTYVAWFTSDTHGPVDFGQSGPAGENVKYAPRTTLVYVRWPWRWMEPKKGKFNWKLVDQSLKIARSRGQTVQLRFQPFSRAMDYSFEPCTARRHPPEKSVDLPDWYWDTGAKWIARGPYAANEPDCNDPLYVKHFGQFIRSFARRYDGHPDLESIDMAYAGMWGESGGNATPQTAARLVDIYLRSFKKTMLLSMLGTHGCKHAATISRRTGRAIGWRADCIGDLRRHYEGEVPTNSEFNHTFDAYPMQIQKDGVKEAWRTAPVTMETCGNVATWFMDEYDLNVIIREGYRYHMSVFMPKNVFYPQAWQEKLAEFDRKIGYRFVLRQMILPLEAKAGRRINLQFFFDNVGCAPIYRPYALAVRFRQEGRSPVVRLKADIRKWLPGHTWFEENITLPAGLKKGQASVDLAIVDAKNKPRVWLAIQGRTDDHWHPLTSLDIV